MSARRFRSIERRGEALTALQHAEAIRALYVRHRHNPLIKWKDNVKAFVGHAPRAQGLRVPFNQ